MSKKLGQILIDAGLIDTRQLETALAEQAKTGNRLGAVLTDLGFATDESISLALAQQSGVEHYDLDQVEIQAEAVKRVPEDLARRCNAVPLSIEGGALHVAMSTPTDIVSIDELQRQTELFVRVASAGSRQVQRALDRAYGGDDNGASLLDDLIRRAAGEVEDGSEDRGAVIALVEDLLRMAVRRDATDLHFQPDRNRVRSRFRVDGILTPGPSLPLGLHGALVARIKVMARLDISENRIPQDGKIRFPFDRSVVDLRVSIFPSNQGESVVVRILDKDKQVFSLDKLGLDQRASRILRSVAERQNGLALAVGPTGSGKSTTLFAILRAVDSAQRKVITLEDPVEYEMPLVTQCQVNEKAGLTFDTGLRSILRHDPDVILVGEMRDRETCRLALRAALTGHLVLSTLHTNHAVASIWRLLDMDLDPDIIATCLVAVAAQRLVRRICAHCRVEYQARPEELAGVGLDGTQGRKVAAGQGCGRCGGSGLRGREALFEVLEVTPEFARLIARRAPESELSESARASGMATFREMAQRRALEGRITLEEVARVTSEF